MAKSFDEMTDRDIQELCDRATQEKFKEKRLEIASQLLSSVFRECIAEVAIGKVEILDSAVNIAMEAADRLMKRNNEKSL